MLKNETRHYSRWEMVNRWNRRGERTPHEGVLCGAMIALTDNPSAALREVRAARERLDALHGHVLDLAPRLRDLCWAIDAANAEPEPEPEA